MSRLFRQPASRLASWTCLAIFALAYLCAMAFVLVPGLVGAAS